MSSYLANIICAIKNGFGKVWHIQAFEGNLQLLLSYAFVGTVPMSFGVFTYLALLVTRVCLCQNNLMSFQIGHIMKHDKEVVKYVLMQNKGG